MEPDAKLDNVIAMMMIKKRIEQNSFDDPAIRVLLERGSSYPACRAPWWSAELRSKDDGTLSTMPGTT